MNPGELRRRLAGSRFVRTLVWHDEIGSTNDEARRLAARGAPQGTVVVAGAQTAGRGRLGRRWHSPPGMGVYVSVLLLPVAPLAQVTRWTLGGAVALCEACRHQGARRTVIEWPNDLTADGRKLAGILAEMRSAAGRTELVLGAGVNVNQRGGDFPDGLETTATSLDVVAGAGIVDAEGLVVDFLERLGRISELLDRGEWAAVARDWERLSPAARARRVRVTPGNGAAYTGVTAGLGAHGELRVDCAAGGLREVRLADSVSYLEG